MKSPNSHSNSNVSKIRIMFLFFTLSSFILMLFGSLYIEKHPENPELGTFLVGALEPVFWGCCGAWILYNIYFIFKKKK